MQNLTPREIAVAALLEIEENQQYSVRTDYSGRGMYGRKCIGVIVEHKDEVPALLQYLVELIEEQIEGTEGRVSEVFCELNWTTDSIGLSTIVYFPGLQAAE